MKSQNYLYVKNKRRKLITYIQSLIRPDNEYYSEYSKLNEEIYYYDIHF